MKGQVQTVLFAFAMAALSAALLAALIPVSAPAAQVRECRAAASNHGHWSWRLIDGRKCWYAGKAVISKSSLKWPAAAPAQAKSEPAPANVVTEKRSDPLDAQARLLDDANSFEARWRARVTIE
jgi:hypothetical protein